jgi:hypothetical protein
MKSNKCGLEKQKEPIKIKVLFAHNKLNNKILRKKGREKNLIKVIITNA